jgi:hypothetical protein
MSNDTNLKNLLKAAYLAGFNSSVEGYNGEYPFLDHGTSPEKDAGWRLGRDVKIEELINGENK